ncbi:MAG: ABC transporter permease subunit [Hamadaea sp.]|uniref:ABC transporter permease subunit n=1 Tax=Hamadaea sp. TaxID=2024425 RepID=UPI001812D631|nr:ABC transporter permease subunit [Hamadaea sp.]NUT18920.1 ABC transporter permease subunit [Hamadaea sp.]
MLSVWIHMLRRRTTAAIWWAVSLAALGALLAVAYPTVRGNSELDKTFADLPPSVAALLGLSDGNLLTSPAGYLDSQFYANILPLTLLIFAVGAAAWTIAGDEAGGTLELLTTNPISRTRIAVARYGALLTLLTVLAVVCWAAVAALAPSTGLTAGLGIVRLAAATLACALLALVFATIAYAVGAATGSKPAATAVAAGLAVAGYVAEGLSHQVTALRAVRYANPWHWLLDADPLRNGLTWQSTVLPVAVSAILVIVGLAVFRRRDLR